MAYYVGESLSVTFLPVVTPHDIKFLLCFFWRKKLGYVKNDGLTSVTTYDQRQSVCERRTTRVDLSTEFDRTCARRPNAAGVMAMGAVESVFATNQADFVQIACQVALGTVSVKSQTRIQIHIQIKSQIPQ